MVVAFYYCFIIGRGKAGRSFYLCPFYALVDLLKCDYIRSYLIYSLYKSTKLFSVAFFYKTMSVQRQQFYKYPTLKNIVYIGFQHVGFGTEYSLNTAVLFNQT